MSRPWMPLYIADYLADTAHFSATEHGAYLLLIMHYWKTGSLPDDNRLLARIARMTLGQWKKARVLIKPLFQDGWKHKRIEFELTESARISAAGRIGGQASGSARRIAKSQQMPNDRSTVVQQSFNDQANDQPTNREALQPQSQRKKDSRSVADATRPDPMFDKLWAIYPKREGSNPKKPAREKYLKLVRDGADPLQIIAGVKRYAEQETKNVGTRFISRTIKWLNQWSPEDDASSPAVTATKSIQFFVEVGTPQWAAWDKYWRAIGRVSLPQTDLRWPDTVNSPYRRGFLFDTELPPDVPPPMSARLNCPWACNTKANLHNDDRGHGPK